MSQKQLAFYAKFLPLVLAFTFAAAMVRYPSTSEKPVFAEAMPVVAPVHTYTTDFPLRENPLSEGGRWIDGKTVGLDWGNISTTPGLAIGHAGPKPFADATALLTGAWGPTQAAEVVVYSKAPYRYPEVSLRLRSSLSPHKCTGYEISNSLRKGKSAYLIIVRWNGPLADFTYLAQLGGKKYAVATGDVVKATIIGNVITAYKNGVQLAQVKDDTFATGNPGMGFNEGINGDYGVSRFSATDAPIDADTATVRGSEK